MRSARRGKATLDVEVKSISSQGVRLVIDERELLLTFEQFPWFREASIREILNVERPQPHHLYWPDLDVDVAVESIEHPEKYPLRSRVPLKKRVPQAGTASGRKRS